MQNLSSQQGTVRRRRAPQRGLTEARLAKQLVSDIQKRLALWHPQLARLRALAISPRADVSRVRAEAAELGVLVVAGRIEMEGLLDDAEDAIGRHSVVRDVMRALTLLQKHLEEIVDGQMSPILEAVR